MELQFKQWSDSMGCTKSKYYISLVAIKLVEKPHWTANDIWAWTGGPEGIWRSKRVVRRKIQKAKKLIENDNIENIQTNINAHTKYEACDQSNWDHSSKAGPRKGPSNECSSVNSLNSINGIWECDVYWGEACVKFIRMDIEGNIGHYYDDDGIKHSLSEIVFSKKKRRITFKWRNIIHKIEGSGQWTLNESGDKMMGYYQRDGETQTWFWHCQRPQEIDMEKLSVGTGIVLKGLKSGHKYNGKHGIIWEPFDPSSGRYHIKLDGGMKQLAVRPVNINVDESDISKAVHDTKEGNAIHTSYSDASSGPCEPCETNESFQEPQIQPNIMVTDKNLTIGTSVVVKGFKGGGGFGMRGVICEPYDPITGKFYIKLSVNGKKLPVHSIINESHKTWFQSC